VEWLERSRCTRSPVRTPKIYVGSDLTSTLTYFGTRSVKAMERIVADRLLDFVARKRILWESETATEVEGRSKELAIICSDSADPTGPGCGEDALFCASNGSFGIKRPHKTISKIYLTSSM
jgi:hypothetical protein